MMIYTSEFTEKQNLAALDFFFNGSKKIILDV